LAIATGTVAVCFMVSVSATPKSFQLNTKVRMAVAARPGAMIGVTIRHNSTGVVAPSSRAASSSSTGTSRTNTPINHSAIGRLSTVCARITAVSVLSRPTVRMMVNQALASASGGNM
jgi:hypothetical protein